MKNSRSVDSFEESVTGSLDDDAGIQPHLPVLLEGMWALGSAVKCIIGMVSSLDLLYGKARILDLGCGKGAVLIKLASKFGLQGVGVDGDCAFLHEARSKAKEYNVDHLCTFQQGDIREFVKRKSEYELVIYASLGGVLGQFDQIITALRHTVKSGGYMLIDDGYLATVESVDRKEYSHYRSRTETIRLLTIHNDRLIQEVNTDKESRQISREYLRLITANAERLEKDNPQLRKQFHRYIQTQHEECDFIEQHVTGAAWILQRVD